jgi:Zn-dependent protease
MSEGRRIDPRWLVIGGIVVVAVLLNVGSLKGIDFAKYAQIPIRFALIFPAIILHEISHGYVAYLLGDPTAKRAGRLTLNPIKHIDPFGTILLPLILLTISGGAFFFGYAKPVPFNPRNFKNERTGMLLTGIAGPVTNVLLAVIFGVLVRFFPATGPAWLATVFEFVVFFAEANLVLAFFNLVPVPPLDGSRVLQWILPDSVRDAYHSIERYGFFVLIALTWLVPGIFDWYLSVTVYPIFTLISGIRLG